MLLLPAPHPGGVLCVAEVVVVLWMAQPFSLTGGLALTLTLGFAAVLLPSSVTDVNDENLSTGQAFGFDLVRHGPPEGPHVANAGAVSTNQATVRTAETKRTRR
jgi:hypothetical protein